MRRKIHRQAVMGDINMVPFIDITLILLIIFMVMTPFIVQSQLKVDLPSATAVNRITEDNVIRVEIGKDGQIRVQDAIIPADKLQEELLLRLGRSHEKTILVQADRDVPVQQVVNVFDIAKKLGAARLGIGVTEKQK